MNDITAAQFFRSAGIHQYVRMWYFAPDATKPQDGSVDELLWFLRKRRALGDTTWRLNMGTIEATPMLHLWCVRPVLNSNETLGKRIATGKWDRVYPIAESYVRML
jgi:hypothetical protein